MIFYRYVKNYTPTTRVPFRLIVTRKYGGKSKDSLPTASYRTVKFAKMTSTAEVYERTRVCVIVNKNYFQFFFFVAATAANCQFYDILGSIKEISMAVIHTKRRRLNEYIFIRIVHQFLNYSLFQFRSHV